jgi:hypothetical protein
MHRTVSFGPGFPLRQEYAFALVGCGFLFGRRVESRFHFPAPFLRVFLVHSFHILRYVGMFIQDMLEHGFYHFVPSIGRYFLITFTAEFLARQCFVADPPTYAADVNKEVAGHQSGQRCSPSAQYDRRT